MEYDASQNEDAETHLREHGGRRGSLVTVRFDGQAVSPGSPSTAERGRLFVVPTASSIVSQPQPADVGTSGGDWRGGHGREA